jgi:hypothetical protein
MANTGNAEGARESVLLIRLSREERSQLDAAATSEHLPTGTWLRRIGLKHAGQYRLRGSSEKEKRMLKFITEETLTACVVPMLPRDAFDTHDVIAEQLSKRTEYLDELYEYRDQQPDAHRIVHGLIGKALAQHPLIVKSRKVKSTNVRGDLTENQEWRKK